MKSILRNKAGDFQNLNGQIRNKQESLESIRSECRGEAALLEDLRHQTANVQQFVCSYKASCQLLSELPTNAHISMDRAMFNIAYDLNTIYIE